MLRFLFKPKSIAIVGASRNPSKVGHSILKNLITYGYTGKVFPVNPSATTIEGLKTYPSLTDIKDSIELAIISIPATSVPQALRECAQKDVKVAIIISAGFREVGKEGRILEEQISEIIKDTGLRVLGPNCLGVIDTEYNLNATFAKGMPPKGRVSFFSQSGALGVAVLDWAVANNVGFSKFISLGNKVDLNETDFIEFLMNDEETDVILGYIEDVVDGKRFIEVARRCTSVKPIILIKSGGTGAGARAASSHTGALAGSDTAFSAAFRQTGIIRVDGVKELFEIARVFTSGKLPAGNRLLIITNAGGPGIIAADHSEKKGLTLPVLQKSTIEKLRKFLPPSASLYNPIDLIGDATSQRYKTVLQEVRNSPDIDGILVILTPQAMTDVKEIAEAVIETSNSTDKPVITSFMGGSTVREAVERLMKQSIPNYSYPEEAINAYEKLVRFSVWKKSPPGEIKRFEVDIEGARRIIEDAKARGIRHLGEDEARECLQCYGFTFPKRALVLEAKAAAREASKIGFPVVMKVSSSDILHKTDVGGVKLGIKNRRDAEKAFLEIISSVKRRVPQARLKGVNIYEMVTDGKEVILGITFDRTFGHMLMFGLGGIYVEILKDVSFRVAPTTEEQIRDMLQEVRSYPILKGIRGEDPVDIEAIVEGLLRLNQLVMDFPEIQELDINPLMVRKEGAIALDARIILSIGG
jgi:acetyltransferase